MSISKIIKEINSGNYKNDIVLKKIFSKYNIRLDGHIDGNSLMNESPIGKLDELFKKNILVLTEKIMKEKINENKSNTTINNNGIIIDSFNSTKNFMKEHFWMSTIIAIALAIIFAYIFK